MIKDIIYIIPDILKFFVPGYIFVAIFTQLTVKKLTITEKSIASCVISFLLIAMVENIYFYTYATLPQTQWLSVLIACLFAVIASIVISAIWSSKLIKIILERFFQVSPSESIWDSTIDLKNGTYLKILPKHKLFFIVGNLKRYQTFEDKIIICISKYQLYDFKTKKIIDNHEKDDKAFIVVDGTEIEHIELFMN